MRPGSWKLVRGNELPAGRQVATWGRETVWLLCCPGAGLWLLPLPRLCEAECGIEVREPGVLQPAFSTKCVALVS